MRLSHCAVAVAAAATLVGPAVAGVAFTFSADIYGRTADSGRLDAGQGSYTVLDLYLNNDDASDLRLLSLFNIDIGLSTGDFVHHDADTTGNWSANYNLFGANTAIDSFATFGAMSGNAPYSASLDPNFQAAVAGSVSADAGWYNNDPNNGQGNVAAGNQIFVGRFVVASDTDTTFTVSGDVSYNLQVPGVLFDSDSQVFTLPAIPVVPGPLALAVFAGVGLAGRSRRR